VNFDKSYKVSRLRSGSLSERVSIIVPTRTINSLRGEEKSWSLLKETWAHVESVRASSGEDMIGDRLTAVNHTIFTVRYRKYLEVEMVLFFNNKYFEIDQIIEPVNERRKSYLQVYAFDRNEDLDVIGQTVITPGKSNALSPAFNYVLTDASGTDFDMSPNTPNGDASKQYNLLYIFRGGLRQMQGVDYLINGNVIEFNQALRGEQLIIHQYKEIEL
jgi:head-tail adaptor